MSGPTPAKARTKKKKAAVAAPQPQLTPDQLTAELAALPDSPLNDDGTVNPVEVGKRGRAGQDMVHVFTLDGTQFFVPKRPNRFLLVNFLRKIRASKTQEEQDGHTYELLTKLLGQGAVDALEESPLTTEEDVADVLTIVTKIAFDAIGQMGLTSGN